MSTPSVVGTIDGTTFTGRPIHSDGYPGYMGPMLMKILARHDGDLAKMLHTLCDKHLEGWSYLSGTAEPPWDFVGPTRSVYEPYVGMAYREGGDTSPVEGDISECDAWGYFFTSRDLATAELVVACDAEGTIERIPVSKLHLATEVDWARMECGSNFERCNHLAWYHVPDLGRDNRLGMRTYLGLEALRVDDAIGCIKDGVEYRFTGSGHSGLGLWYAGATYLDGTRAPDVAYRTLSRSTVNGPLPGSNQLLAGVTAIYPPTAATA